MNNTLLNSAYASEGKLIEETIQSTKDLLAERVTELLLACDKTLDPINNFKRRLKVAENTEGMKRVLSILVGQVNDSRVLKAHHEDFIDDYLQENFNYRRLKGLKNELTVMVAAMKGKEICDVDFSTKELDVRAC